MHSWEPSHDTLKTENSQPHTPVCTYPPIGGAPFHPHASQDPSSSTHPCALASIGPCTPASSPPEWARHRIPLHIHTSVHSPVATPVLRGDLRAQAGGAQRGLAAKAPVQRRRLLGLAQQHLRRGHTSVRPGPGCQDHGNRRPSPHLPLHGHSRWPGQGGACGRPEVRLRGRSPERLPGLRSPGPRGGRGGTSDEWAEAVGGGAWP